ncbi:unnamed protein product, partial [Penicillium discolor]
LRGESHRLGHGAEEGLEHRRRLLRHPRRHAVEEQRGGLRIHGRESAGDRSRRLRGPQERRMPHRVEREAGEAIRDELRLPL